MKLLAVVVLEVGAEVAEAEAEAEVACRAAAAAGVVWEVVVVEAAWRVVVVAGMLARCS